MICAYVLSEIASYYQRET